MMNRRNLARVLRGAIGVGALSVAVMGCTVDFTGSNSNNNNVPPGCGNGILEAGELCDGTDFAGQSCDSSLGLPYGELSCTPECLLDLSDCNSCGDGVVDAGEACDDANGTPGDGCSERCQVESGWICMGEPSLCSTVCGDGLVATIEGCDDGNTASGDGCSAGCDPEPGWVCTGEPSQCVESCGNSVVDAGEGCDDGNLIPDDGCSPNCVVEAGWHCAGDPSVCGGVCGDGLVVGAEPCDDGNTAPGDGCTASCTVETGWRCDYTADPPLGCVPVCGDGLVLGTEACDDGNTAVGDGCSLLCTVEPYAACDGEPSVCTCVVYVDRDNVSGPHDGSTWATAYDRVFPAVLPAWQRTPCEIWVAEGVYYTYEFGTGNRIDLMDNVELYGGFTGTEVRRDQRDFNLHVTELSAEQEGNPNNRTNRVLYADADQGVVIDGFTVSRALGPTSNAGGMRVRGGSSVVVRNCNFIDNVARRGGGIAVENGTVTISDCTFSNNSATDTGGALGLYNNAIVTLERNHFVGNSSTNTGGAIYGDGFDQLNVARCRFDQNTAQDNGGAIRLQGGGANFTISDSIFWQNDSQQGGGALSTNQFFPTALVTGCTFHDNLASIQGDSLRVANGALTVRNTILWGSTTDQVYESTGGNITLRYSTIFGGGFGQGVIALDPLFTAPATGNLYLTASSPCIDAADGDLASTADFDGNPRTDIATVANSGVGTPAYVDMGAYERQP